MIDTMLFDDLWRTFTANKKAPFENFCNLQFSYKSRISFFKFW